MKLFYRSTEYIVSFFLYIFTVVMNIFIILILQYCPNHKKKCKRQNSPCFYNTLVLLVSVDLCFCIVRSIVIPLSYFFGSHETLLNPDAPFGLKMLVPLQNGLLFSRFWIIAALALERAQNFSKYHSVSKCVWEQISRALMAAFVSTIVDALMIPEPSLRPIGSAKYDFTIFVSCAIRLINTLLPSVVAVVVLAYLYRNYIQTRYNRFVHTSLTGILFKVVVAHCFASLVMGTFFGLEVIVFRWTSALSGHYFNILTSPHACLVGFSSLLCNVCLLPHLRQTIMMYLKSPKTSCTRAKKQNTAIGAPKPPGVSPYSSAIIDNSEQEILTGSKPPSDHNPRTMTGLASTPYQATSSDYAQLSTYGNFSVEGSLLPNSVPTSKRKFSSGDANTDKIYRDRSSRLSYFRSSKSKNPRLSIKVGIVASVFEGH